MPSVLIVEDDPILKSILTLLFARDGFESVGAKGETDAMQQLESNMFDLVLTDLRLERFTGLDILAAAKKAHSETEVIILTAFGSVETAVQAIQNGANDYITKPFNNDELLLKARKAIERKGLRAELKHLRQEVAGQSGFDSIIGGSRSIAELKKLIGRIAATDIAVLLTGESGTGKELFAKIIHHHSARRDRPLVTINCSTIPENLLESELFGHVRGALTSAVVGKKGLLEEADKGTIFLDEIADLPPALQAKLLRVLQEMEIRPVGGTVSKVINVRFIAAANADLSARVSAGKFREDLYYRLNVMPLHIPPLRERPEDIPLLTDHFLKKIRSDYDRRTLVVSPEALELLVAHPWPGNVRELENTIKRAAALSTSDLITRSHIVFISPPENQLLLPSGAPRKKSLEDLQRCEILRSLQENKWNYSQTASRLGIGRTTLWRKIKKYDLAPLRMARPHHLHGTPTVAIAD